MKRWKTDEEALAITLIKSGKTYSDIAFILNRSTKSVKEKLPKLGFKYFEFSEPRPIKFCACCGNEILHSGIKFCSRSCAAKINNEKFPKRTKIICERKPKSIKKLKNQSNCLHCGDPCGNKFCSSVCQHDFNRKIQIDNWKNGLDVGFTGKTINLKRFIRNFILEKSNNECSKCGWNEIHSVTGKIPLEINHIDGDATNCIESNLEAICPNCHSLTPNFRALNKSSKRNR